LRHQFEFDGAGSPAVPKPPIITVAPSGRSASAAAGEGTILSIMRGSVRLGRMADVVDAVGEYRG
jgi:hypothetical protein